MRAISDIILEYIIVLSIITMIALIIFSPKDIKGYYMSYDNNDKDCYTIKADITNSPDDVVFRSNNLEETKNTYKLLTGKEAEGVK
jgi:hypothetical protein